MYTWKGVSKQIYDYIFIHKTIKQRLPTSIIWFKRSGRGSLRFMCITCQTRTLWGSCSLMFFNSHSLHTHTVWRHITITYYSLPLSSRSTTSARLPACTTTSTTSTTTPLPCQQACPPQGEWQELWDGIDLFFSPPPARVGHQSEVMQLEKPRYRCTSQLEGVKGSLGLHPPPAGEEDEEEREGKKKKRKLPCQCM